MWFVPQWISQKEPAMAQERKARLFRWESIPKEPLYDKLDRRMITGDRMMITHVYLKKGCLVPRHQHVNEQITYVLEGALRFRLGASGDRACRRGAPWGSIPSGTTSLSFPA